MKILSTDIRNLLDKIYNLRGEDSTVLAKITSERTKALETQERTKNEKETLLKDIEKITNDEKVLEEQGNKLVDILSSINKDDFNVILKRLNIDFEPDKINDKVKKTLPETINSLKEENEAKTEELKKVEEEMNNSITLVEELGLRKDEALSNQAKLNEYIDLALSGNINITRDAITSLLEKFEFNENEQREAAKLLMFPEDALFDYDTGVKNGENIASKSMADVISEAREHSDSEDVTKEISEILDETAYSELATFEDTKDEEAEPKEIERMPQPEPEVIKEEPKQEEIKEEVKDEPKKELTKEQLMEKLSGLGVENGLLSVTALTKVLDNYDEELINKNINILKENDISFKILKSNANLLYDKELGEKITKLLEIGKLASDISLMPNVLSKYDLKGLTNTINVLQISGLDPKKVPLMAF